MSTRHFCDRCDIEILPMFARYSASISAKNEYCAQETASYEDLCGLCACEIIMAMRSESSNE